MNYLISLLVGFGVGLIYAGLGVRSPAPPIIALLGLLGMLGGEFAIEQWKTRAAVAPTAHAAILTTERTRTGENHEK